MKTLRLILGDQLNHKHSWYSKTEQNTLYFIAEMRQETDYVNHHIQKVVGFFASMRNFHEHLKGNGHQVIYYEIDSEENKQDLVENLKDLIQKHNIEKFEYQLPDEYRLDEQLRNFCNYLNIQNEAFDTEHFYTTRTEMADFYKGKKEMTMEYFYRDMRKKHELLMENKTNPEGGKWNFDKSNRKKWSGKPEIPHEKGFRKDVSSILKQIEKQKIKTIGNIDATTFNWPTSRADSLQMLNYFCDNLLIHFGDYQDALHTEQAFLFHSRLSFSLNSKMLSPQEVVNKAIETYYDRKSEIDISQVEGFVRQILGWREYMRGIYWMKMPEYQHLNKLDNQNKLPDFYWTGNTKMNCLSHSITQSLDNAYAHHIQRLMITGNFALLTQIHPDEVDAWYLGIYIDAIEWVEMPNTRGMSQYADGGIVATKPYISSGSYINKMGNYCKTCVYNVNEKTGENACPFNSLYWNFLNEKREYFKHNQRMSMMMSLLEKMNSEILEAHIIRAHKIIENPDDF
ncbi:cryptochrome/photolyase family protein [Aequorivita lipolytica]|uniref:Cryptochrome/photolyase family protein n=1 Tax=Aequorivita lipolytica TaxID=153267 RepID=A0A5C6YPH7_9FLAO|nr:cryptochrome/photolyase family protein [Aequorivita lipolytica]TXD69247.1 cryptochrome/photolyase family protein [Aequorivita lipolytica]SRX50134.1 (6-4) photolyase [Aequorivita lipolytica]